MEHATVCEMQLFIYRSHSSQLIMCIVMFIFIVSIFQAFEKKKKKQTLEFKYVNHIVAKLG